MSDFDEAKFRAEHARENDHGKKRISLEEFEAITMHDYGGYHVEWREKRDGRWVVVYRGLSCGFKFQFFYRPIITVRADA